MQRLWLVLAFVACVPAVVLTVLNAHTSPIVEALAFGGAILCGAFILSWAAEVAQMDMSKGLAVAILALICVLPEYAVDMYFAWRGAVDPAYVTYAAANMTGANRLLVGIGWPAVFLLYGLRFRRKSVVLEPAHRTEIAFLGLATLYSFKLVLQRELTVFDTLIYLIIYGMYTWRVARADVEEPELVGPAQLIGKLSQRQRRWVEFGMFAFSAAVILASAHRFADALVQTGRQAHIDEFVLVQWVAPLASEAPEFIVALLWSFRGQAATGLGALVSSRVNQWTLLIGTLPLAYSAHLRHAAAMPLDERQQHEILLTACQSLFAVAVLANLRMSWYGTLLFFLLFIVQVLLPHLRLEVSIAYVVLACVTFVRDAVSGRRHGSQGAPSVP